MILDSSCLFYFAWPRASSRSDGFYLSPLSDMSPATSDCLEPYFSGGFCFSFPIIARVDFSGSIYLFIIFSQCVPFLGSYPVTTEGVRVSWTSTDVRKF